MLHFYTNLFKLWLLALLKCSVFIESKALLVEHQTPPKRPHSCQRGTTGAFAARGTAESRARAAAGGSRVGKVLKNHVFFLNCF